MNMEKKLESGTKLFFINESLPMEIIARSKRYAVCTRSLDLESDFELLAFEVERGAYFDSQSAWEALKDEVIYTIVDFQNKKRGPHNMIFNFYEFESKSDCQKCLKDMENGKIELSRRREVDLNIDWERTNLKVDQ